MCHGQLTLAISLHLTLWYLARSYLFSLFSICFSLWLFLVVLSLVISVAEKSMNTNQMQYAKQNRRINVDFALNIFKCVYEWWKCVLCDNVWYFCLRKHILMHNNLAIILSLSFICSLTDNLIEYWARHSKITAP